MGQMECRRITILLRFYRLFFSTARYSFQREALGNEHRRSEDCSGVAGHRIGNEC